jgi:hypothetical protein
MNANLQKCDKCQALNTESLKTWVRVLGATNNKDRPVNIVTDLCPACAESTKVSELPAIAAPKAPVAAPAR